jgi:hypothetical protein
MIRRRVSIGPCANLLFLKYFYAVKIGILAPPANKCSQTDGSALRILPVARFETENAGPCSGLVNAGNRGFNNVRWLTFLGLLDCSYCISICLSSLDLAVLIVRALNKLFGFKARTVKPLPAIDKIAFCFSG